MYERFLLYSFFLIMATATTSAAQTFGPADAVDRTGSGSINWTTSEVYATGIGAPPPHPANAAQARAMAERAAFVVALRNLLETVKGVRVDSESIVENFMTKSDVIRTKVDGIVKGARTVKTQYLSDGSVEVLVALSLKGEFLNTIVPETFGKGNGLFTPAKPAPQITVPSLPPVAPGKKAEPVKPEPQRPTPPPIAPVPSVPLPKPEPERPAPQTEKKTGPAQPGPSMPAPEVPSQATVAFKGGVATGMVIDGRGLGLRPALLPRIIDQQGQELYVGQVVPRTNAVEQGVAGYAKDVQAAANNFRVTDNPAVIKAVRASGNARTDLVINQADAQAFRELGKNGDFLKYCRVIIVY
jgi:hypothetical protein